VRIHSNKITFKERGSSTVIGEDITWEGTTTERYRFAWGTLRRMIVNPNANFNRAMAVWARNHDCEVLD